MLLQTNIALIDKIIQIICFLDSGQGSIMKHFCYKFIHTVRKNAAYGKNIYEVITNLILPIACVNP